MKTNTEKTKGLSKTLGLVITIIIASLLFVSGLALANESPTPPDVTATLNGDGLPYLDLVANNVSYDDLMHIYYCFEFNLDGGLIFDTTAPKIKMLFWDSPQSAYVKGTESYAVTAPHEGDIGVSITVNGVEYGNNCVVMRSHGIPAKAMADTVYARAYVEDESGNVIFYSAVSKYSVLRYVYDRFEDKAEHPELVTDDQMTLYRNILRYGGIAQKVLEYNTDKLVTDKFADVRVTGGVLSDGFARGLYADGESYEIIAPLTHGTREFRYWEDSHGNRYLNNRKSFTVNGEPEDVSYVAVFGSRTDVTVVGGTGSGTYFDGENYTVSAPDRSADKYAFLYWTDGEGNVIPDSELTMTFTAGKSGGSKTYTAHYAAPTTVTVVGGTVNLGRLTDGSALTSITLAPGEAYAVTAVIPEGKSFKSWTGGRAAAAFTLTAASDSAEPINITYTATFGDSMETLMAARLQENGISGALASELMHLADDLFGADIYEWVAELYDPEVGAFYYSISARDHYGFLPDVESSEHALSILFSLGLSPAGRSGLLPAEAQAKYTSWVQSLQNGYNGKFYHPQWGINVSNSRDGRDQQNAILALYNYGYLGGGSVLFDNGAYGKSGSATRLPASLTASMKEAISELVLASVSSTVIAERFESEEKFLAYMQAELVDRKYDYYSLGNYIVSQTADIKKYGLGDACIAWFTARQDATTGLWSADTSGVNDGKTDYDAVSALMKIGALYSGLGVKLPNADKAFESAINAALLPKGTVTKIVDVYNPLYAMHDLYESYKNDADVRAEFDATVRECAAELISVTREKLARFSKPDGAYSYLPDRTITSSQGPTVSLGLPESDGNATAIAIDTAEYLIYILTAGKTGTNLNVLASYVGAIYVDETTNAIVTLTADGWVDGDGNVSDASNVIPTSHLERFRALIGARVESYPKREAGSEQNLTMTFDGDNVEMEEGRYSGSDITVENGAIKLVDSAGANDHVSFIPVSKDDTERFYEFGFDMTFVSNVPYYGNTYWIEINNSLLRLNIKNSGNAVTFTHQGSAYPETAIRDDKTGVAVTLDASSTFNVNIRVYPGIDNPTEDDTVALVTLTQGARSYTATLHSYYHPSSYGNYNKFPYDGAAIWGYASAASTVYIDNVRCINHNAALLSPDGDYNFERAEHVGGISGGTVSDDAYKAAEDNVYRVESGAVARLVAKQYSGIYVPVSYNTAELKLRPSDGAEVSLLDSLGNTVFGVKLVSVGNGRFRLVSADGLTLIDGLTATEGEWIQLRIDCYYATGRVDVVLRYNDTSVDGELYPDGLYRTVGATLEGASLGGTAADFDAVAVTAVGSAVELDDVYVRNVKTAN